jgi:oligopeptidase B
MKDRIKQADSSVPAADGPYAYYARYREEGQHPLLCRSARNSSEFKQKEQVLLDGDELARGTPRVVSTTSGK